MFTYKGKSSRDMGLQINGNLEFEAPRRDVNLVSVAGRDGDLVMDNGRFEAVTKTINCRLKTDDESVESVVNRIHNWLAVDVGYHDFLWSGDPAFTYLAMVESPSRTERVLSKLARMALKFRLHPVKYLTSSLTEQRITSGTVIDNPFVLDAKPVIRVVGTGTLNFTIGGQEFELRNIDNGITVDSESMTVASFDGRDMEFDKLYGSFPVLKPGDNLISFSGTGDFQVFITSRLGALV